MSKEHKKDDLDTMEITGNWNLKFELRSGSNESQGKGVYLDQVILIENVLAETIREHMERTSTTSTLFFNLGKHEHRKTNLIGPDNYF